MATKQKLPTPIAAMLDAAAAINKIPATLARAVAWVESRGNPRAESGVGARGIMQLMPGTAQQLGVTDPFDPEQNIAAGVEYLAKLLKKYGGSEVHALAAYNWGPGNVDKAIASGKAFPEQVLQYTRNVQTRKVDEGSHAAATPFFSEALLCLQCPYCSQDVSVRAEVELMRVRIVGSST
jgi:soluble lytic murein transglycosylase-like protein